MTRHSGRRGGVPNVEPCRGEPIDNLILRHVSRGSNEIYARFATGHHSRCASVRVCVLTQLRCAVATCRSIFQRVVSWLTFSAPFTVWLTNYKGVIIFHKNSRPAQPLPLPCPFQPALPTALHVAQFGGHNLCRGRCKFSINLQDKRLPQVSVHFPSAACLPLAPCNMPQLCQRASA